MMKARTVAGLLVIFVILALSSCAIRVSAPGPDDELFTYAPVTDSIGSAPETTDTVPDTSDTTASLPDEAEAEAETDIITETNAPETVIINHYAGGGSVWGNEPQETYLITSVIETVEPPRETDIKAETKTETQTESETETEYTETEVKQQEYSTVALMYHSINEEPFTSLSSLFVRPTDFEDHLATLNSMGYKYLFADEFEVSEQPTVMLTFDDGYEDNYTEMFPILKEYNAKATVFMVTSKIDTAGYLTSEQIIEMAESGLVRFASHTHDHLSLTSLSEDALRYQFETSKNILTQLTGYEMNAVCYPGGSVSDFIVSIAEDYFDFGYTTVSSSYTYGCDPMLIPRVRVSRGVSGYGLASLIKY